jgi:hypothetical protein
MVTSDSDEIGGKINIIFQINLLHHITLQSIYTILKTLRFRISICPNMRVGILTKQPTYTTES